MGRGGQTSPSASSTSRVPTLRSWQSSPSRLRSTRLAITDKPTPVQLGQAIGGAIETELRLQWYKKQDKDLYRQVEKNFHGSTGTGQKATVFRLRFNKAGLEWDSWGHTTVQFKVGSWALRSVIETTGWVDLKVVKTREPKPSKTVMRFSRSSLGCATPSWSEPSS